MFLLNILLLTLPALSIAEFAPEDPLQIWLSETDARRALIEIWSGQRPSIVSAFKTALQANDGDGYSRCLQDLSYILNANTLQTFNMLDSSVKIPEGIFAQVWTHLGNWDQCVGVRDVVSPQGRFNGQMCMVKLYPTYIGGSTNTISLLENRTVNRGADPGLINQYLQVLSFTFAECVPSSCSAAAVEKIYKQQVETLPSVMDIKLAVSVSDNDCTTQDRPALDSTDWSAIGIIIALGALALASTLYDILTPASGKKSLLIAFSVVSNGRKLLSAPRQTGDVTLSCLHGLRFISMAWVLVAHRYSSSAVLPVVNPKFRSALISSWPGVVITNATVSVDTFFVLSGLLVGYLFFKQVPSKRKINIPLYYLHRYIRLTPVLAMMVLLTATLVFRVGWGPIWTESLIQSRDTCRDEWWNILLYIGNFFENNCVEQSWYLMVDMQLHWLSPLALYLLVWRPRVGSIVLIVLCFASIVANFLYSYLDDLAGSSSSILSEEERKKWLTNFYFPTYIRFVPYVEGLLLGYYMATQRFLGQKPKKLNFIYKSVAWITIAALLLVPLISGKNVVNYPGVSTLPTAFFNALHRPAWGLGIMGVVYLCASGNAQWVNSLLSWYWFQVLGRFSYCVYLVHMALHRIQRGIMKAPSYLTHYIIITNFFGDLLMSLFLGGILSVLCESPFIILEKELLGKLQRKNSTSNHENVQNRPRLNENLEERGGEKSTKTS